MKSATEILQAIGIEKNKYTSTHAKKIAGVYSFLNSISDSILKVEHKPENIFFGCHTEKVYRNREWQTDIKNEGTEMPSTQISVTTKTGNYSFNVPAGTPVENSFFELLGIESKKQKTIIEPLQTIAFDADFISALKNAVPFVSQDDLRPTLEHVLIEFKEGTARVISTDCHRLYMSRYFFSLKITKPAQYLVPVDFIKKLPKKCETADFCVLPENQISINGITTSVFEGNFPNYPAVVPNYEKSMLVDVNNLCLSIKQVLPAANKVTSQVNFLIGDDIELISSDVDFSYQTTARMSHLFKGFDNMAIAFNGKFLLEILGVFKHQKTLKFYSDGAQDRGAIFTDGVTTVLCMPLLLAEGLVPPTSIQAQNRPKTGLANKIPAITAKPTKTAQKQAKKEPQNRLNTIFANYLNWLFESSKNVFIHQYADKIRVRYLKIKNGQIIRGARQIGNICNLAELAQIAENIAQKNGQNIIKKAA